LKLSGQIAISLIPWIPIISGSTKTIFIKFSQNVRELILNENRTFLYRSVKGRCYGNQFYWENGYGKLISYDCIVVKFMIVQSSYDCVVVKNVLDGSQPPAV